MAINAPPNPRRAQLAGDLIGDVTAHLGRPWKAIKAGAKKIRSARSRNRAAAFNRDLDRWYRWVLSKATTAAQREAAHAEYHRRQAIGPDWANHHVGSNECAPHVNERSHDHRRATLAAFDKYRADHYANERKKRGQGVPRSYREVLGVLLSYAVRYGACYPSQARIAELVVCSERTVRRAICWLREKGFITWKRRLRDKPRPNGSRQTSNAYKIVTRAGLVPLIDRLLNRLTGQNFRPSSSDGGGHVEIDVATPLFQGVISGGP